MDKAMLLEAAEDPDSIYLTPVYITCIQYLDLYSICTQRFRVIFVVYISNPATVIPESCSTTGILQISPITLYAAIALNNLFSSPIISVLYLMYYK